MFFFNLSLVEFLAIFGTVSGLVVTLYLLNRTRRKQIVATLRFWTEAQRPTAASQRRRIQQPFSLLLQLLSIALLLLAIAQLRLGSPDKSSRDHVVLLDTSSWMGSRAAGANGGTLLDQAKVSARSYFQSLPSTDRVMVVFADGLATPATGFTSDRQELDRAIQEARPAASALNIGQALAFAREVQKLHAQRAGETVYIGAGRISPGDVSLRESYGEGLRVLKVGSRADNYGLKRIGLRRSVSDPGLWEA
ncbi:MAG: vWA domain-containing protein, partial [Bryobacteraceae bacterium]